MRPLGHGPVKVHLRLAGSFPAKAIVPSIAGPEPFWISPGEALKAQRLIEVLYRP